jgi:hypothetical protein
MDRGVDDASNDAASAGGAAIVAGGEDGEEIGCVVGATCAGVAVDVAACASFGIFAEGAAVVAPVVVG